MMTNIWLDKALFYICKIFKTFSNCTHDFVQPHVFPAKQPHNSACNILLVLLELLILYIYTLVGVLFGQVCLENILIKMHISIYASFKTYNGIGSKWTVGGLYFDKQNR